MASIKSMNFVRIAATIFLVVFFYATSISLTFYNKWMSKKYRFPLTVSMIHFSVVFLLAALWRKMLEIYYKEKRIVLDCDTYTRKVFPTAISASLDIGLSNWSVMLSTVSLYTMAKSTSIIFILIFSLLLGLEKMTWRLLGVVCLIALGLFLFTFESKQFNMLGFAMAILASAMSGVRWTTAQMVMQKKSLGLSNPVDTMFHVQPVMALTIVIIAFCLEGPSLASSGLIFRAESLHVALTSIFIILVGAFLAFLLTLSEFLLVSRTSSLALSIAGIFKEVCTLTLATELGGDRFTSMNFIGLVVCLLGISLHVISNAMKDSSTKELSSNHNNMEDAESIAMRSLLHEGFVSDSDDEVFYDTTNRKHMKNNKLKFKIFKKQNKHGD